MKLEDLKISVDLLDLSVNAGGGGFYFLDQNQQQHVWVTEVFSDDELEAIKGIGLDSNLNEGRTMGGNQKSQRNSQVSFLFPNDSTHWIFEKLKHLVLMTNRDYYNFDLHGLFQGLQFTVYTAPGNHYTWHQDIGGSAGNRKLSLTIQLSDADSYEGGDLELMMGDQPIVAPREKGTISFFPSWVVHRVTPVTKGTRYSLVAWVSGPPFK